MGKDGSALKKDLDQKQIILVVALFVVLGAVLYFFVFSGGGDEPPADLGAPPVTEEPPLTESPEEEPVVEDPTAGTVETFELFTRRDPFEPVIDTGSGAGDFGTPGTTDGSPDTGGAFDPGTGSGTDTGTTLDPTTGGDPTSGGTNGGSTSGSTSNGSTNSGNKGSSVGGHRVKLIDVFRKNNSTRAQVQVDGTVYTVDPGETFATSFQLVSASGECASMLFGDDQFTMCEGEEILK